jgi:lysozyme
VAAKPEPTMSNPISQTLINGGIGLLTALAAGFVGGYFAVIKETALERQKFQLQVLTDEVHGTEEEASRAEVLYFLLDSGVLDSLETEKLRKYAKKPIEEPDGRLQLPNLVKLKLDSTDIAVDQPSTIPEINSTGEFRLLQRDCGNVEKGRHFKSDKTQLSGFDISHHNGELSWGELPDDLSFAMIKATEGSGFTDTKFRVNWDNAHAEGLVRGAYHFYKSSKGGAVQARQFLAQLQQAGYGLCDLPPVLDLENFEGGDRNVFLGEVQTWLNIVERATGRKPIISTFNTFWENELGGPKTFGAYPLWIVDPSHTPPNLPSGWSEFTFHTTSFHGTVSGIKGGADLDMFNGKKEQLLALTVGTTGDNVDALK